MKQSYDFTAGPIGRPLLLYTLPRLLANVLQSFYQLVDLLVVGRIVGETGLAAISSASTVCFLITSLGTGLTTGGMVRVAQQAGAKDTTGLVRVVSLPSRPAPRTPPAWRKPRGPFSPLPWSSPFWWLWQGP